MAADSEGKAEKLSTSDVPSLLIAEETTSSDGITMDASQHIFPDGGLKAWLTVFGAALMLFCCGQLTAFSVFETYYAQHQLEGVSPSTISWIGSLQLWILYFSVRASPC